MLLSLCRRRGDPSLTRTFRTFHFEGATYRIASSRHGAITDAIVSLRREIERYIDQDPDFRTSFSPVRVPASAPEVVRAMADAARLAGVGPMAAVAGAIAQHSMRRALELPNKALATEQSDHIVDNGGDIYLRLSEEAVVGLYAGEPDGLPPLALRIAPGLTPLAICSSSSRMGHSASLGDCNLATVLSHDGALADAAATAACNGVRTVNDVEQTLERIGSIPGVMGALIVKEGHVGMIGNVPPIERAGPGPV